MSGTQTRLGHRPGGRAGFEHEALFYRGAHDFLEGTGTFVQGALDAGAPVMVALLPDKIDHLRHHLGTDAGRVEFVDMAVLGRNPGRIIPAWKRFVERNREAPALWGIGEPVWAARSPAELTECQRHEALLNDAFAGERPWSLLCPYDMEALSPDILEMARRTHPFVSEHGRSKASATFSGSSWIFDGPLAEPAAVAGTVEFDSSSLRAVRAALCDWAAATLPAAKAADLLLAAHEAASNSVRHGGGRGVLRYWKDPAMAVVEVSDHGRIRRLLAGRDLPQADDEMGRGLWLVHQLCDLVQVRSTPEGTIVRMHMALA